MNIWSVHNCFLSYGSSRYTMPPIQRLYARAVKRTESHRGLFSRGESDDVYVVLKDGLLHWYEFIAEKGMML